MNYLDCKNFLYLFLRRFYFALTSLPRINNDDKLREKVDEALTVYDEYVKAASQHANVASKNIDGKGDEYAVETEVDAPNA